MKNFGKFTQQFNFQPKLPFFGMEMAGTHPETKTHGNFFLSPQTTSNEV